MKNFAWVVFVAAAFLRSDSCYSAIQLPAPGGGLSQAHGNFEVYSLPFLDNLFGGSTFNVQSSPGQIQDGIVIMTGASGNPVNNNPSGMDDAYSTPSGNGAPDYFQTGAGPFTDPSGNPSVDGATTWDADVAAIRTFLGGAGDLVFFFNLNDTNGSGGGLINSQDQLGWARLDLIDNENPLATKTYFLSAADDPLTITDERAAGLVASAVGAPDPNGAGASLPGLDPQWAYVHGIITVAADGTFLHYGELNGSEPPGASEINQNLGQNDAAFAMFNEELNDLVLNPLSGYDRISIDIRLARIDNGFEQSFILPMVNVTPGVVPEAASVATWLGLSLVGGLIAWRRRCM